MKIKTKSDYDACMQNQGINDEFTLQLAYDSKFYYYSSIGDALDHAARKELAMKQLLI